VLHKALETSAFVALRAADDGLSHSPLRRVYIGEALLRAAATGGVAFQNTLHRLDTSRTLAGASILLNNHSASIVARDGAAVVCHDRLARVGARNCNVGSHRPAISRRHTTIRTTTSGIASPYGF
jgi:hypothetical protein